MKKNILSLSAILISLSIYASDNQIIDKKFDVKSATVEQSSKKTAEDISLFWKESRNGAVLNDTIPPTKKMNKDVLNIGLGVGLDYGGIGGNLLFYPQRNIGFFFGAGYALVDMGMNVGAKLRFISKHSFKRTIPYVLAMNGYNTAIKVKNASYYSSLIYGKTIGVGIDFRRSPYSRSYWSFGIYVPFRGWELDEYKKYLESQGVQFDSKLMPILFSIGYRLILF